MDCFIEAVYQFIYQLSSDIDAILDISIRDGAQMAQLDPSESDHALKDNKVLLMI